MNKILLIPRMALQSIRKNSATYLPYMGVCVFSMFTYFVFGLIINNDVMQTIPRAAYAQALMLIGFILLAIIMVPFLFYTNSFLIKRRKKELGLYSILGMEKKHIGMMLLVETAVIYVIVEAVAAGLALLFSKLVFLLLINLAKLPVRAEFAFSGKAFSDTLIFFGVISFMNLFTNLWQVGKANPIDLMSESKKGEKEPKALWLWSVLGVLALGTGYRIAIQAKINSTIFTDFFLAVFLVVAGTYFLFTSGSIVVLRMLKRRKKFYYRPENFVTVSGMLYRMKKNAASLVNICIFGTMVIITAVCTVSLYFGTPGINAFMYPYLVEMNFIDSNITEEDRTKLFEGMASLADQNQVSIEKSQYYSYVECFVAREGNSIIPRSGRESFENRYGIKLLSLEEFNRLEQSDYSLGEDEVFIFSSGPDFLSKEEALAAGEQGIPATISFMDKSYEIKEELRECSIAPKEEKYTFGGEYIAVLPNEEDVVRIAALYGVDGVGTRSFRIELTPEGTDSSPDAQACVESYVQQLQQLAAGTPGFAAFSYFQENIMDQEAMYGGLLFIGIFFGLIFLICLLVIMYYKQITEGHEDRSSFEIMQKVGMSDKEVRNTIRKQILLVFFLPLLGAACHTAVGMKMVIMLMGTINMFDEMLIIGSAVSISALFAVIYILCYWSTAGAYYKIVRWR